MAYTLQHYTELPVWLLDSDQPLDFYRGLKAVRDEMALKWQSSPNASIYLILNLREVGSSFEILMDILFQREKSQRALIQDPRVHTILIGESHFLKQVKNYLNREHPSVALPMFNSHAEAEVHCHNHYFRS